MLKKDLEAPPQAGFIEIPSAARDPYRQKDLDKSYSGDPDDSDDSNSVVMGSRPWVSDDPMHRYPDTPILLTCPPSLIHNFAPS